MPLQNVHWISDTTRTPITLVELEDWAADYNAREEKDPAVKRMTQHTDEHDEDFFAMEIVMEIEADNAEAARAAFLRNAEILVAREDDEEVNVVATTGNIEVDDMGGGRRRSKKAPARRRSKKAPARRGSKKRTASRKSARKTRRRRRQ